MSSKSPYPVSTNDSLRDPSIKCYWNYPPSAQGQAFTLIELLVVIAVIAVLAALAATGIGAVRKQAAVTKSLHQLQQISHGIQLYTSDNNNTLPGPLFTSIQPRIRSTDTGQLATRIAPYLGYELTNTWQTMDEMIFASWEPHIPPYNPAAGGLSTLMCNWDDYDRTKIPGRPFGYPGSDAWSSSPIRKVQVEDPEKFWLISEQSFQSATGQPFFPTGGKRMFVFMSGRVSLEDPGFYSYKPW